MFDDPRSALEDFIGSHKAVLTQGLGVKTGGSCRDRISRMDTITTQMKALLDAFQGPMVLGQQEAYNMWQQANVMTEGAKMESRIAPSCEFRRFIFYVMKCMLALSVGRRRAPRSYRKAGAFAGSCRWCPPRCRGSCRTS